MSSLQSATPIAAVARLCNYVYYYAVAANNSKADKARWSLVESVEIKHGTGSDRKQSAAKHGDSRVAVAYPLIIEALENVLIVTRNPLVCSSTRTPIRTNDINCDGKNGERRQPRSNRSKKRSTRDAMRTRRRIDKGAAKTQQE